MAKKRPGLNVPDDPHTEQSRVGDLESSLASAIEWIKGLFGSVGETLAEKLEGLGAPQVPRPTQPTPVEARAELKKKPQEEQEALFRQWQQAQQIPGSGAQAGFMNWFAQQLPPNPQVSPTQARSYFMGLPPGHQEFLRQQHQQAQQTPGSGAERGFMNWLGQSLSPGQQGPGPFANRSFDQFFRGGSGAVGGRLEAVGGISKATGAGKAIESATGLPADRLLGMAANVPRAMAGDPVAMASLAKEALTMTIENTRAALGHFQAAGRAGGKFMRRDTAEGMGLAALEGGKEMGKGAARLLGGPILGPVLEKMVENNPMLKFTEAILQSVATVRQWNKTLLQADLKFAEFSASMTAVAVRQQLREMSLSIERGERRAPSTEALAASSFRLDRALAPIEDDLATFKDEGLAILNDILATAIEILKNIPLVQVAHGIAEIIRHMRRESEGLDKDSEKAMRAATGHSPYFRHTDYGGRR